MYERIIAYFQMSSFKKDCIVDFYSGTGKGGQNRNRHYNCVRIRHVPTGIIVTAQDERSQSRNLTLAWARMQKRLEALRRKKPVRVPTKKSGAIKQRILTEKKKTAEKKQKRAKINRDDW